MTHILFEPERIAKQIAKQTVAIMPLQFPTLFSTLSNPEKATQT